MKVLLISGDYPPINSGEANHAFYLAQHFGKAGLSVSVLTSAIDGIPTDNGIAIYPIMRTWSWLEALKLTSLVRKIEPDVILLVFLGGMYQHHPMITFAATLCRAVRSSVSFVTQIEALGIIVGERPLWTRLVRKMMAWCVNPAGTDYEYGSLLRDSNHVIVLSQTFQDRLVERLPEIREKCTLIPPAPLIRVSSEETASREETRRSLGVAKDEFLLINYGQLYPSKGIETLLVAMHILTQQGTAVRLIVVGGKLEHVRNRESSVKSTDYMAKIRKLSKEYGIARRVIWAGHCPPEGSLASRYFYAADACVLPFDNGVHLNNSSFVAAAAHCLPIITTRSETTEDEFRDGDNVLLCPPKTPSSIAANVLALIENPQLRRRLRDGVQEMVYKWYSWEGVIQRTIKTFF